MKFFITIFIITACLNAGLAKDDLSAKYQNTNKPFKFHGRISQYNGGYSTFRIWIIGTKRLLGVAYDDTGSYYMPKGLENLFTVFNTDIYADFSVTPITKYKKGHMQMVKIDTVKNMVIYKDKKFVKKMKKLSTNFAN